MQVLIDGEFSPDSDGEDHNVCSEVLGICFHIRVEPQFQDNLTDIVVPLRSRHCLWVSA